MKVIVYLKNGKKLTYFDDDMNSKYDWLGYLSSSNGAVRFSRFVVPKDNINYVEFYES